jgi:hypothetical protein
MGSGSFLSGKAKQSPGISSTIVYLQADQSASPTRTAMDIDRSVPQRNMEMKGYSDRTGHMRQRHRGRIAQWPISEHLLRLEMGPETPS